MAGRRNPIPPEIEAQLLEMPELKRGRFIEEPSKQKQRSSDGGSNGGEGDDGMLSGGRRKELGSAVNLVSGLMEAGKMYHHHSLSGLDGEGGKDESNHSSPADATRNLLDIEPNVSSGRVYLQY